MMCQTVPLSPMRNCHPSPVTGSFMAAATAGPGAAGRCCAIKSRQAWSVKDLLSHNSFPALIHQRLNVRIFVHWGFFALVLCLGFFFLSFGLCRGLFCFCFFRVV